MFSHIRLFFTKLKEHLEDEDTVLTIVSLITKAKDSAIPIGCALSQILLAFKIVDPPASITDTMYNSTTAYLWSLLSFIAYLMLVLAVWIRPGLKKVLENPFEIKGMGVYVAIEHAGLIAAAFFTGVYTIALTARFGIFSPSIIAIGTSFAVALYYFCRWLLLVSAKYLKNSKRKV